MGYSLQRDQEGQKDTDSTTMKNEVDIAHKEIHIKLPTQLINLEIKVKQAYSDNVKIKVKKTVSLIPLLLIQLRHLLEPLKILKTFYWTQLP